MAIRVWLLVLFAAGLLGCSTPSAVSSGPSIVIQGDYSVQLATEPELLQAGQPATFIVAVRDTATGDPATEVLIRPIFDMTMPDGMGMTDLNVETQPDGPGQFRLLTTFDHAGAVTLSLTLDTPGGLIPVRFPPRPVNP